MQEDITNIMKHGERQGLDMAETASILDRVRDDMIKCGKA